MTTGKKVWQQYLFKRKLFTYFNPTEDEVEKTALNTMSLYYTHKQIEEGFIVRYDGTETYKDKITHADKEFKKMGYMLFDTHMDFLHFFETIPTEKRNFHEIIYKKSVKPHFDIDLSWEDFKLVYPEGDKEKFQAVFDITLSFITRACIECLAEFGIKINPSEDMVLCTSHGENKRSGHLVITSYTHENHSEAEAFYNLILNRITSDYTKWIDAGVYKSFQSWRIVGNFKDQSARKKIFCEKWKYINIRDEWETVTFSPNIRYNVNRDILKFESSLLMAFNSNYLPSFLEKASDFNLKFKTIIERKKGNFEENFENIDPQELKVILDYLSKALECQREYIPFKVKNAYKNIIFMIRLRPSECKICNVVHQSENPYIFIRDGNVYLDCRRSQQHVGKPKYLFLGKIESKVENNIFDDEDTRYDPEFLPLDFFQKEEKEKEAKVDFFNLKTNLFTITKKKTLEELSMKGKEKEKLKVCGKIWEDF